jgi:hypothetical protein
METPEEYQRLTRVYHEDLIESLHKDMQARKLTFQGIAWPSRQPERGSAPAGDRV